MFLFVKRYQVDSLLSYRSLYSIYLLSFLSLYLTKMKRHIKANLLWW